MIFIRFLNTCYKNVAFGDEFYKNSKIPIAETLARTQFAAAEAKEIANVRKSVAQGKRTVRKNLEKKTAKK